MSGTVHARLRAIHKIISLINPDKIFENGRPVFGKDPNDPTITISLKAGNSSSKYSEAAELLFSFNGVISGLTVSTDNTAHTATITAGTWRFNQKNYYTLTPTTLTISTQDGTLSRYEAIYADNTGALGIVHGTLSATPVIPAIPSGSVFVASVLITPTSLTIAPADPLTADDFVTKGTPQTITATKTFTTSPQVPAGISGNDAINFAQIDASNGIGFQGGIFGLGGGLLRDAIIGDSVNSKYIFNIQSVSSFGPNRYVLNYLQDPSQASITTTVGDIFSDTFGATNAFANSAELQAANNASTFNPSQRSVIHVGLTDFYLLSTIPGSGISTGTGTGFISNSTIQGIQVADEIYSAGAAYLADYSTQGIIKFGNRWIPDLGYISAHFGTGSGTVTNVSPANTAHITIVNQSTTPVITLVSAPKLTTARTIQGVSFDGTANINILNGAGLVRMAGTTISYDNTTYLSTTTAASTYQTLANLQTTLSNSSTLYPSGSAVQAYVTGLGYLTTSVAASTYMPIGGGTFTGNINLVGDATTALQPVSYGQFLNWNNGFSWKHSVIASTTTTLPAYTTSGSFLVLTATSNGAFPAIDGVTVPVGENILVKNESGALRTNNGGYTLTNAGSGSTPWILTRMTDSSSSLQLQSATYKVREGSTQSFQVYTVNVDPVTLGTTQITFALTGGAGTYLNGTGILLTGNIFSIDSSYTASASQTGYLSSTDWSTFNNKVTSIAFVNGGGFTGTIAGTTTAPTLALTLRNATTSLSGQITSTDWNTFNNKLSTATAASTYVPYTGSTTNVQLGATWLSGANIGVGTGATTPSAELHVVSTSTGTPRGILSDEYQTGTSGSRITMRKARGTFASPTTIVTADVLGSWTAAGHDGTGFIDSGKILVTSTGTVATGIIPSIMELQTMTAAGTLTTGIKIDQAQALTFGAYGTGLLHSGSSGAITSSLIVNADITNSTIDLTAKVTGILPVANGGTGLNALGTGIATFWATPSSANFFAAITDETGSGLIVGNNTPTLITPVLGIATATSINKLAITAPATSATLALANNSSLNTAGAFALTLTTTATTNVTFPAGTGTLQLAATTLSGYGITEATSIESLNTMNVAFWGDSLTAGQQGNGISLPSQFSSLTGYQVFNGGIGGQTSTQISSRQTADTAKFGYCTIIWAGQNNFTSSSTVQTDIAAIVTALGHTRYLVLGILVSSSNPNPSSNYTAIAALNSALSSTYGVRYVDVMATLLANGDGSGTDNTDIANGVIPTSLRASGDVLHLNTKGYGLVSTLLNTKIAQLQFSDKALNLNNIQGILGAKLNHDVGDGGTYSIGGYTQIYAPNQFTYTGTVFLGTGNPGTNPNVGNTLSHSSGNDGQLNTYVGWQSGFPTTTGNSNSSLGAFSLTTINSGIQNTSIGSSALRDLTTGTGNTAIGYNTGRGITTGSHNIIIGDGITGLSTSLASRVIIGVNGTQIININGGGTPTAANFILRTGDSGGAADLTAMTVNDLPLSGTPVWTGLQTFKKDAIANTPTDAILIENTTAALVGTQVQYSPAINFQGNAWKINATAASQQNNMRMYLVETAGNTATSATFNLDFSLNGGAFATRYSFGSGGATTFTGGLFTNSLGSGAAVDATGILSANQTSSTSGVPVQNIPGYTGTGTVWNTSGTPATNTFGYRQLGRATSSGTPTALWVWQYGLSTTTTVTYTDLMTLSGAGILSLLTAPTVSSSTYDILSRNTSTGAIEKVSSAGLLIWSEVVIATQTIVARQGYIATSTGGSQLVFTLPATAAVGDIFSIVGNGSGGWKIAQNASQLIKMSGTTTTAGTGGSVTSGTRYDSVEIICIVTNTTFAVRNSQGTLTLA